MFAMLFGYFIVMFLKIESMLYRCFFKNAEFQVKGCNIGKQWPLGCSRLPVSKCKSSKPGALQNEKVPIFVNASFSLLGFTHYTSKSNMCLSQ